MKKNNIAFYIYLIILFWSILFKFGINYNTIPHFRSINLIPYIKTDFYSIWAIREIIFNIIIFIPFGYYLSKYLPNTKVIIITIILSLFFEISQYIFSIGGTDITDIINNVIGSYIGLNINNIIKGK